MKDQFKPLLAAPVEDLAALEYPLLASPKLDGVRAVIRNGVVTSRSLKPIPNKHVQALFGRPELEGLDGELMCGDPCGADVFRDTTSAVMSIEGTPDVQFHVFDLTTQGADPFSRRLFALEHFLNDKKPAGVVLVPQTEVTCATEVDAYEVLRLGQGYEGVMLRSPDGVYKHGRSTLKERTLLKLKRFADSEATILACVEQLHNANEAKRNALGQQERSSAKAGMRPMGVLGAFNVRDVKTGVEFDIGTGFTAADRDELWKRRAELVGKIVKYKYFPTGSKDKPRFPVFLAFRDKRDMS
jgi:DNA ligase-1